MRAHQPGSTPIDIPETVPNPAHTPAPAPAPAPERAPTKAPDKVPEKVIATGVIRCIFLGSGPRHGPRLSACLIKELCIPLRDGLGRSLGAAGAFASDRGSRLHLLLACEGANGGNASRRLSPSFVAGRKVRRP
jgi:hypothetical protein